jgi:cytochrome c peroxidase
MTRTNGLVALAVGACLGSLILRPATAHDEPERFGGPTSAIPDMKGYVNATGVVATHSAGGRIDIHGAFFQPLGINGRSCATCHELDQAMSLSVPRIQATFARTQGRDPLFAAVDGANCPTVRTGDRSGHSLMLQHGLVRVGEVLPANAQFTLTVVHDPYGCALVTDARTGQTTVSVYRRPLPSTNLGFLSAVMFDGRETVVPLTSAATFAANLRQDLTHQAASAITTHFQATSPPTDQQLADIVDFELGLSTAQVWDWNAGLLSARGALGGPLSLARQEYYPGMNDVLGADPNGDVFDSSSMTLFQAWERPGVAEMETDEDDAPAVLTRMLGSDQREGRPDPGRRRAQARADIAAGEKLFNTAPLTITNVRGLNDSAALNHAPSFQGTCTTCHDAPNVGDHSLPLPLDIGVGHTPRSGFETDAAVAAALAQLDEPDLPIFLVQGCPDPFSAGQPASFYTTDPGKALVTGLCGDLNRVKGPILRGLAARAPYFHNGAAQTLLQAVNFYNERFAMKLTERQKEQLAAFLNSL